MGAEVGMITTAPSSNGHLISPTSSSTANNCARPGQAEMLVGHDEEAV